MAGVGSFSQRVLIPGLLACPDAALVGIYGPTRAKTEQIAQARGIAAAYAEYERMLDEVEPQAVVVATPNDVHHRMVMAALRRGLAVFCEKPLGIDVAQAREMADAARAAGVPTAVNFTYRSTNPMRHVHRLLQQGRLGELFHFSIAFWQNVRADPSLPLAYRMLRERGGGALLDIGVHMMDLLRWWFGDLAAVCGVTRVAIAERAIIDDNAGAFVAGASARASRGAVTADDTASFVARLANGAAGTIQVSQVATGRQNYRRVELFGSEGAVAMEEDRTFPPQVRLARPGDTQFVVDPLPDDLDVSFEDFPCFHLSRIVAALRGRLPEWPGFDDGLQAQLAVEAVEESQRTGSWVALR